ncbi:hypothetical protein LguiA_009517 [Lonicera macranthoides]
MLHGCEREYRERIRHMRSVPTTRTLPGDSLASTSDSFFKDGRRISVGDCALFKPPQSDLPFIGIIRRLSSSKDNNLLLGVNWLYRPSEVKLGKGILLDAAPNEIFYSFHKDEIPAASLLHPCKVAFLPKGVELSPGLSSFVCRQVYDIANNCLWCLTDQDYIDEQQQEVDQLLYKTRIEMHATVQPGGRSPKPLSVNTSTSQLKPTSDNVQSSSSSFPSQVKRKKREQRDQGSEPSKRERSSKSDDSDSSQFKAESILKSEIAKITEKGGLMNSEGVEKLVQLMQPNREERKMDLVSRSMLAGVIAATDRFDCLSWFVQLRGLPVLDEWLQDIHRGKIGDGSSILKNGDKSVEEFLLVLLRALDKLPVNLHALQMCNIGKSVNHLRTNKNLEIQRKARSLVDTWKKRVEAEMNSIDSKSGSSQPVSWSSKSRLPEVSHGGTRHPVGPSEIATKSSVTHISATKTSSLKPVRGETTTMSASSSPRTMKAAVSPGLGRDGHPRISVGSGGSFEDRSVLNGRAASPVLSEKHDQSVNDSKEGEGHRANVTSDVNAQSWQSNDINDLLTGSDVGDGSPDAVHDEERSKMADDTRKSSEVSKAGSLSSENELESGKLEVLKLADEASFCTLRSLIETCVKYSEANASLSVGDDVGMELLASVAAGEVSKSDRASPNDSPQRNKPVVKDTCIANDDRSKLSPTDILALGQSQPDIEKQGTVAGTSGSKGGLDSCERSLADFSGDRRITYLSSEASARNSCNMDLQPAADPFVKTCEKSAATSMAAAPSIMPVSNREENAVINNTSLDGSPEIKPRGCTPLLTKDKVNDLPGSVADKKQAVEISPSSHLLENEGENIMDGGLAGGGKAEQNPPTVRMKTEHVDEMDEKFLHSSNSVKNLVPEEAKVRKTEELDTRRSVNRAEKQFGQETDNVKDIVNQGVGCVGSAITNQRSECADENIDGAEVREQPSGGIVPHRDSPAPTSQGMELHGRLRESKVTAAEAVETEECASTTADISRFSASAPPHMDAKVKFDLNEGFVVDDGKFGEPFNKSTAPPAYQSVHVMNQLPFPVSSASSSLPASVTVAAAAKRPFLPPEDLLRCKGELGWTGSAATSAFRPAEPRKVPELPFVTTNIPIPDATASRPGRPLLDIDLNAPGEGVLDDVASQDTSFNCDLAPARGFGGLGLDLNQADEANDMEQYSISSSRGLEFPLLPVKSSSSGGEVRRVFDLNNGPALEDVSAEPLFNRHGGGSVQPQQPQVGGIRVNRAEVGNFSSWFAPPGNNTGPAVGLPSILSNRGEKPFPVFAPGGAQQRILGPPTGGGSHFTPDVYWGSVLSSSPTVPFPSTPFQYPVVPYMTSFPLPSSTLSGGSATYVDSSSGGRICFPAINNNSQLQGGPGAAGSSQYPRPYMVSSLQDGSSNGVVLENNRKWAGRQGLLDLNAGPGSLDIEGGRDESTFPHLASRKLTFPNPQALAEEQQQQQSRPMLPMVGGGLMKRKEPDGAVWDPEGFRYKQSSWQ